LTLNADHLHDLAQLPVDISGPSRPMALWVPSERISLHLIPRPSAPERKWPELLPWIMEDRVLQPVEQMHFVVLGSLDPQQLLVAAVSRADISQWLTVATSAGVVPKAMVPDYLALPWEEGRWTLYWRQGVCLVRTGALTGFAAPAEIAWTLLQAELERQQITPRLSLSVPDPDLVPEILRSRADINGAVINWSFTEAPAAINLLTGAFRPAEAAINWRPWLPTLALAVVVLLLVPIYLLVASQITSAEIDQLRAETLKTYSRFFPGDRAATEGLRNRAEQNINLLFRQRQSLDAAPFRLLQDLDGIMSRCTCDLQEIQLQDNAATLRMKNSPELKQKFADLQGFRLQWSAVDAGGLVQLQLEAGGS